MQGHDVTQSSLKELALGFLSPNLHDVNNTLSRYFSPKAVYNGAGMRMVGREKIMRAFELLNRVSHPQATVVTDVEYDDKNMIATISSTRVFTLLASVLNVSFDVKTTVHFGYDDGRQGGTGETPTEAGKAVEVKEGRTEEGRTRKMVVTRIDERWPGAMMLAQLPLYHLWSGIIATSAGFLATVGGKAVKYAAEQLESTRKPIYHEKVALSKSLKQPTSVTQAAIKELEKRIKRAALLPLRAAASIIFPIWVPDDTNAGVYQDALDVTLLKEPVVPTAEAELALRSQHCVRTPYENELNPRYHLFFKGATCPCDEPLPPSVDMDPDIISTSDHSIRSYEDEIKNPHKNAAFADVRDRWAAWQKREREHHEMNLRMPNLVHDVSSSEEEESEVSSEEEVPAVWGEEAYRAGKDQAQRKKKAEEYQLADEPIPPSKALDATFVV